MRPDSTQMNRNMVAYTQRRPKSARRGRELNGVGCDAHHGRRLPRPQTVGEQQAQKPLSPQGAEGAGLRLRLRSLHCLGPASRRLDERGASVPASAVRSSEVEDRGNGVSSAVSLCSCTHLPICPNGPKPAVGRRHGTHRMTPSSAPSMQPPTLVTILFVFVAGTASRHIHT